MAHYLSEVTHLRLGQRVPEEPDEAPDLLHTHNFESSMRCVEVVPFRDPKETSLSTLQIWTGNIDGTLSVRQGLAGQPIHTKEKIDKNVFVYALLCNGPYMWCGLSNGQLHIYDIFSFDFVYETKAHTGAINCMVEGYGSVFTAGGDWQIIQWDPIELRRPPHAQMSGHQNAVRCMVSQGSTLYSGADDCTIRCWDLDTGFEKTEPWPIIGHKGAVRALCLHEIYLFSAGQDGVIKVWNTQLAQLVRQLDRRYASVNTLLYDPSCQRVWSGASDGTVSIWSATTLNLITELAHQRDTNVPLIKLIARVNALKAWTVGTDGKVRIFYSENETSEEEYQALSDMEQELQRDIEATRSVLLSNYEKLKQYREQLKILEDIETKRKSEVSEILAHHQDKVFCRDYLFRCKLWLLKHHTNQHKQRIAETMEKKVNEDLSLRYFFTWMVFANKQKEHTKKSETSALIKKRFDDALGRAYVQHTVEAVRREKAIKYRARIAEAMSQWADERIRARYFLFLFRIVKRNRRLRKRQNVVNASSLVLDRTTKSIYFEKLERFVRIEQRQIRAKEFVDHMAAAHEMRVLRMTYGKLFRNAILQKKYRRTQDMVKALFADTETALRRNTYRKWLLFGRDLEADALQAQVDKEKKETDEMERMLNASAHMSEEEMEEELKKKQQELALALLSIDELDGRIHQTQAEKKLLQRDLQKAGQVSNVLDENMPPMEQLFVGMEFLKAQGVDLCANAVDILKAKELCQKGSPTLGFKTGFEAIKKVCSSTIRPHKLREKGSMDWIVDNLFQKITKRNVLRVNTGIVQMCVAIDMMDFQTVEKEWGNPSSSKSPGAAAAGSKSAGTPPSVWNSKAAFAEELIANFGVLLELAVFVGRAHRGEDIRTGVPLKPIVLKGARARSAPMTSGERRASSARRSSQGEGIGTEGESEGVSGTDGEEGGKKKKKKKKGKGKKKGKKGAKKKKIGKKTTEGGAASSSSPAPRSKSAPSGKKSTATEGKDESGAKATPGKTPPRRAAAKKSSPAPRPKSASPK